MEETVLIPRLSQDMSSEPFLKTPPPARLSRGCPRISEKNRSRNCRNPARHQVPMFPAVLAQEERKTFSEGWMDGSPPVVRLASAT